MGRGGGSGCGRGWPGRVRGPGGCTQPDPSVPPPPRAEPFLIPARPLESRLSRIAEEGPSGCRGERIRRRFRRRWCPQTLRGARPLSGLRLLPRWHHARVGERDRSAKSMRKTQKYLSLLTCVRSGKSLGACPADKMLRGYARASSDRCLCGRCAEPPALSSSANYDLVFYSRSGDLCKPQFLILFTA